MPQVHYVSRRFLRDSGRRRWDPPAGLVERKPDEKRRRRRVKLSRDVARRGGVAAETAVDPSPAQRSAGGPLPPRQASDPPERLNQCDVSKTTPKESKGLRTNEDEVVASQSIPMPAEISTNEDGMDEELEKMIAREAQRSAESRVAIQRGMALQFAQRNTLATQRDAQRSARRRAQRIAKRNASAIRSLPILSEEYLATIGERELYTMSRLVDLEKAATLKEFKDLAPRGVFKKPPLLLLGGYGRCWKRTLHGIRYFNELSGEAQKRIPKNLTSELRAVLRGNMNWLMANRPERDPCKFAVTNNDEELAELVAQEAKRLMANKLSK